jgi:hypothetical protein
VVVNLSSRVLTPIEKHILSRGLLFAVTPRTIRTVDDVRAELEAFYSASTQLPMTEHQRLKLRNHLYNLEQLYSPLALKRLKKNISSTEVESSKDSVE